MLNGIDPIIIFNFSKATPKTKSFIEGNLSIKDGVKKNNILAEIVSYTDLPSIPIYLSESLTGILIDSEEKSIEIETDTETLTSTTELNPQTNQRALNSTLKINMQASKNSLGLTLLTAMADVIFPKVTSKEYSITYLHGAATVFGGLLHSFNINQNSTNELYNISIEIVRTGILPKVQSTVIENNRVTDLTKVKS